MSNRKFKVYGGLMFIDGQQLRTIVATTTKKMARELVGVSAHEFNNYWCETRNDQETRVAMNNLLRPFFHSNGNAEPRQYKKLPWTLRWYTDKQWDKLYILPQELERKALEQFMKDNFFDMPTSQQERVVTYADHIGYITPQEYRDCLERKDNAWFDKD